MMRPLVWLYRPLLGWALRHRVLTLGAAVLVLAGALALVPRLGTEFMPPLDEGSIFCSCPSSAARRVEHRGGQAHPAGAGQDYEQVPEVKGMVLGKAGRASTATEATPR